MVAVGVVIHPIKQGKCRGGQVFGGGHYVEHHGLVSRQAFEETQQGSVAAPDEESVIPGVDQVLPGQGLDVGKVHHHSVQGRPCLANDIAQQRDLDGVAMAVQMAALALVVGNAVTGIEFEAAGDAHGASGNLSVAGRIITLAPRAAGDERSGKAA